MSPAAELDVPGLVAQLRDAVSAGKLSASAAENIRRWLTEPPYAEYAAQVVEHIGAQQWQKLDDVFWTVIPFGTGGRRGAMHPIGTNAINDRTIGESIRVWPTMFGHNIRRVCPSLALWPTTRGTAPGISRSFVPRSWLPPGSASIFSTDFAAPPNCPSRCAIADVHAA